jgi:hypothetical protein
MKSQSIKSVRTFLVIMVVTMMTCALYLLLQRKDEGEFACIKADKNFPKGEVLVSKYTRSKGIVEGLWVSGNYWGKKFEAFEDKSTIRYKEINGGDYAPIFYLDKESMRMKIMLNDGSSILYQCDWSPQTK